MKIWRSISVILLTLIVIFPLQRMSSHAQQQEMINTIFLLRHAEKADDDTSDPPLTEAGWKRAAALADLLVEDGENDRLYVLIRHLDGQVTTILLRYGERFRP